MIRNAVRLGCLLTLLGWACGTVQAQITFDLSGLEGTVTPFSDTQDGLTANFSSPADPSGFAVYPANYLATFAPPISGNDLSNAIATLGAPLDINFSQTLSGLSLDFATLNPELVTLQAFVGGTSGTLVASASTTGVVPDSYSFPQGVIGLTSAMPFDTVELTYGDYIVAANFVATVAVPEPASFIPWLLGSGSVLGYAAFRRRSVRGLV